MLRRVRVSSAALGLYGLARWWRARGVLTRDGVIALLLAALAFAPGLAGNGMRWGELAERPLDGWGVLLALAQCLPLVLRRRWPTVCLALVGAAFCTGQLLAYPSSFGSQGVVLALYAAGAYAERARWRLAAVAAVVYAVVSAVLGSLGSPERPVDFVVFGLVLAAFWGAGGWMRTWRARESRRQELNAQLAVAQERARIARELHDVVTHHVTAIVVQSDAARFLLPADPDRVAEGLDAIGSTGRRTLVELRYLLDVLDRQPGLGEAEPDRGPVPAADAGDFAELVETSRAAGQPVELVERGERRPVPGGVALAVHRVVQEALTNAVKYAPGGRTVVDVAYADDGIEIEVADDGPAAHAAALRGAVVPSGGRGLAGLRERVGVFGGELSAGPRPGGGFAVRTRLPLGDGR